MADGALQADFVARVRVELDDTVAPYTWADGVLRQALDDAITEYSQRFPLLLDAGFTTTAGQFAQDLQTGLGTADRRLMAVLQVQCPPGTVLPDDATVLTALPGSRRTTVQAYHRVGPSTIRFRYELAGDEVGPGYLQVRGLYTYARFTVDSPDLTTLCDVPGYDWRLLELLAARHAWSQAQLLGVKTAANTDPGQAVAALGARIAGLIAARRARATSRPLSSY
jgi:hypothetical protein